MRITAACGNCQRDLLLSQLVEGPVQAKQTVVPELELMAGRPATTLDTQGSAAFRPSLRG
jgi:hypothetical protein